MKFFFVSILSFIVTNLGSSTSFAEPSYKAIECVGNQPYPAVSSASDPSLVVRLTAKVTNNSNLYDIRIEYPEQNLRYEIALLSLEPSEYAYKDETIRVLKQVVDSKKMTVLPISPDKEILHLPGLVNREEVWTFDMFLIFGADWLNTEEFQMQTLISPHVFGGGFSYEPNLRCKLHL